MHWQLHNALSAAYSVIKDGADSRLLCHRQQI